MGPAHSANLRGRVHAVVAQQVRASPCQGEGRRFEAGQPLVDEGTEQRPTKQVIVIRRDLRMRRGKEIAQGAHASMAWLRAGVRCGMIRCFSHAIEACAPWAISLPRRILRSRRMTMTCLVGPCPASSSTSRTADSNREPPGTWTGRLCQLG